MKKMFLWIGVILLISVSASVSVAFAQEGVVATEPAVSENSWASDLWEVLQPFTTILVEAMMPILVGVMIAAVMRGISWLGVTDEATRAEIERKLRDALHSAAENALKYALAKRTGKMIDMITGEVPESVIIDAMEYVKRLNPDGVKVVGTKALEEIILSKVIPVQAQLEAAKKTG